MTRKYDDQELFDLFHENLPPVEVPPMLAARIRQSVMAEVADLSEVSQQAVGLDAISPVASTKASGRRLAGPQQSESGLRQFFDQIGRSLRWAPSLAVAGATVAVALFFFYLIPSLYPQGSEMGPTTGSTVTTELAPVTVSLETAVVTISDGNATLVSDAAGGTQNLGAGTQVEMLAGDELITLDGRATIDYFPGQVTSVEPGTHVVLTELAEENNGTQVVLDVRVGTVRSTLDPLTETSDRFEVRTPVSMARVVGTDFTVSVASDAETYYAVHEGVVEVEMDGQRITVMAGDQLDAVAGQPLVTSTMEAESVEEPEAVAIAEEPTAVPTYTEAPTATETSLPTETPTSESTATPLPTETPAPTETLTPVPTATLLPTETATVAPTATPLPTETATTEPSATLLPSATATGTATETPVPTSTATSTATVTATSTSTRPPTSTPTVTPIPVVVDLVSPNHKVGGNGDTTFRWRANVMPPEGQAFELIFWSEGDNPLVDGFGLGRPTRNTSLTVDLNYLDDELRDLLDPGEYYWGVLQVREEPYERLQLFTDSRIFRYHGPDSNGSAPSPGD